MTHQPNLLCPGGVSQPKRSLLCCVTFPATGKSGRCVIQDRMTVLTPLPPCMQYLGGRRRRLGGRSQASWLPWGLAGGWGAAGLQRVLQGCLGDREPWASGAKLHCPTEGRFGGRLGGLWWGATSHPCPASGPAYVAGYCSGWVGMDGWICSQQQLLGCPGGWPDRSRSRLNPLTSTACASDACARSPWASCSACLAAAAGDFGILATAHLGAGLSLKRAPAGSLARSAMGCSAARLLGCMAAL